MDRITLGANMLRNACKIGVLVALWLVTTAWAADVTLLSTPDTNVSQDKILALVAAKSDMQHVGSAKVKIIFTAAGVPDHLLVFKSAQNYLVTTIDKISVDQNYNFLALQTNYVLTKQDLAQRELAMSAVACPAGAEQTQFIVFAPAKDAVIQQLANDVISSAKNHRLNTVALLQQNATAQNYLNYMACPNLIGNFAITDGMTDVNTGMIATYDGVLTSDDIDVALQQKFGFKVTSIWAASNIFAGPMARSIVENAQAQKFIAGISQLSRVNGAMAAVCTMETIMDGTTKIGDAFDDCWRLHHDPAKDIWGMNDDRFGSDVFPAPKPNYVPSSSNSGSGFPTTGIVAGAIGAALVMVGAGYR